MVSTKIPKRDGHFSHFFEDNSLLVQFILAEFVHVHQATHQIKSLLELQKDSAADPAALHQSLNLIFSQLVGSHPRQAHSSNWSRGSLSRFKEYCEHLSNNSAQGKREHIHLHMSAHHVWLMAVHTIELVNTLFAKSYEKKGEKDILVVQLKRTCHSLQIRFKQVIRHLPKVIASYWNNENVILCLLRRKTQLAEIYGSDFLGSHFKWPAQTNELTEILSQRYKDRGFESILTLIEQMKGTETEVRT